MDEKLNKKKIKIKNKKKLSMMLISTIWTNNFHISSLFPNFQVE